MPFLVLFDEVDTSSIRKRFASLAGALEHSEALSGVITVIPYTLFLRFQCACV